MADKVTEQKEVESTVDEVEKTEKPKAEEASSEKEEVKAENGETTENGDSKEKEEPKTKEKNGADVTDKCCIKRKSAGGDAPEATPAEGATPEKKAKLDEATEAESNGEAEVAA